MLPKQAKFDLKCSKMRWRLGLCPRPRWGAYDAPPDPLVGRGLAPSALANRFYLGPLIFFQPKFIPSPNSTFPESPMVLSNLETPPPRHFGPRFPTFGASIVWAPYLFSCNSTTGTSHDPSLCFFQQFVITGQFGIAGGIKRNRCQVAIFSYSDLVTLYFIWMNYIKDF